MVLNREKLAELLGCSLRTVDEYTRQGMPGEAPKRPGLPWKFNTAEVVDWLRTRERTNALGEIAGIDEAEARKRKLAAEAAIAEHELAEKQGSAVSVADWQAATAQMIGSARAKLLGIGAAVGRDVALETDAATCEAIVQTAINEALLELSEGELQIEPDGEGGAVQGVQIEHPPVGTTSGPDSKRVGRRRKTPQS